MIKIYRAANYKDMSRMAANVVSAQVILKPDSVLGLATGSSPVGLYGQLIDWYKKGDLDFSQVYTVNLDEYKGLGTGDPQSYRCFMEENLFAHINVNPDNINIPDGLAEDGQAECLRYTELIRSLGGIDLQLLGMGHNGHIGFNEPSDHFAKDTHLVQLAESTIAANTRFFDSADDVPRQAYTMGIGTIMHARHILIIISGKDKAEIAAKAFQGPITPQVPASVLQLHSRVTLIGDEDALSMMDV